MGTIAGTAEYYRPAIFRTERDAHADKNGAVGGIIQKEEIDTMTTFDNARSTLLAIAPADKTAALLTALDDLLEAAYLAGKQVGAPGALTSINQKGRIERACYITSPHLTAGKTRSKLHDRVLRLWSTPTNGIDLLRGSRHAGRRDRGQKPIITATTSTQRVASFPGGCASRDAQPPAGCFCTRGE